MDALDREAGAGSRCKEEDWLDVNTTASEDQWSTANTTFRASEAPAHRREHFESLYRVHAGWGESDRRGTIRRSCIVSDAETFCSILELPKYQKKRIVSIAEEIDLSPSRFGGKAYEKVLLSICSLVSDKFLSQRMNGTSDEIMDNRLVRRDDFRELMDVNNLSSREHNRIRQMLREKTEYFDDD